MNSEPTYNLLNSINYPEDLRKLTVEQLPEVCGELRQDIIKELLLQPRTFRRQPGDRGTNRSSALRLQYTIRPYCMGRGASGIRPQNSYRTP